MSPAPYPTNQDAEVPVGQRHSKLLDLAYRQHWSYLCRALRRRFGQGPPEPEDIVQSAFIKLAQMDDPSAIADQRGFLYTVARNLIMDYKRRHSRHEQYIDSAIQAAEMDSLEEITPERVFIERERFTIINKVIKSLPEKQRQLLLLSRIHGESYDTIAQLTGYSPADISRQIKRAMQTLQTALQRTTDADPSEEPR